MRLQQCVTTEQAFELQKNVKEEWDIILKDDMPFAPSALKKNGSISAEQYLAEQRSFGSFALDCWTYIIERVKPILAQYPPYFFQAVDVGVGKGHTLDWIVDALLAGLEPVIIEPSHEGLKNGWVAAHALIREYVDAGLKIPKKHVHEMFVEGELVSLLAGNKLDFSRIKILGLVRVIQFIKGRFQSLVLQEIGKNLLSVEADPHAQNQALIINPCREDNRQVTWGRSNPPSFKNLRNNLRRGAQKSLHLRSLKVHDGARQHLYFQEQIYKGILVTG